MTTPLLPTSALLTTDLGTFLGNPSIDTTRAQLMLDGAIAACSIYLNPLPETAEFTVLSVAARAYANPTGVVTEGVGPFHVRPGDIYLTKQERQFLKSLAGRAGAFSIDPTPVDAGQGLDVWDQNVTWIDGIPLLDQPFEG